MMKKLFTFVLFLLGVVQNTYAQEPYAVLSADNTTLTFYYDGKKASRNGMDFHGWDDQCENITSVVFDKTFANYKDETSTAYWFYRCSNLKTINGIENLNTANVTGMSGMFAGCSNLTSLDVSNFNTTNVTDMSHMFYDCLSLTSLDVSGFNTANVTDMNSMFAGCSNLTSLDVSKFNTANVTDMNYIFYGCSNLTSLDVSNFNTANVTGMEDMFGDCSNLTSLDVSNFNTANVTDMSGMFAGCPNLTSLDVSKFNTANVTDMHSMFRGCSNLTSLDVSKFNTANVTDMNWMFLGCSNLTRLDVSNFNTRNVSNLSGMFSSCSGLTSLNVSNFDTKNVTDMRFMFSYCKGLTSLDVSNFDTGNVTDMNGMFDNCSGLTSLDVSNFDTGNVTNMCNMFQSCENLASFNVSNFNTNKVTEMNGMFNLCNSLTSLDLSSFDTRNVTSMQSMFQGCRSLINLNILNFDPSKLKNITCLFQGCEKLETIFCKADFSAIENGIEVFNMCTNLEGGNGTSYDGSYRDKTYARPDKEGQPGYFVDDVNYVRKYMYARFSGSGSDKTMTFYYGTDKTASDINLATGPVELYSSLEGERRNITHVVFDDSFAEAKPNSTMWWFRAFENLQSIEGIANLNTCCVTYMIQMFSGCSSLISLDVSHFNISNVKDMNSMFEGCTSLKTIYCEEAWSCENSVNMFNGCTSLVGAISYDWTKTDGTYANPATGYFTYKGLHPMDDEEVSFGEGGNLNENTDLGGTVVDNVFFNISPENGSYDAEEKCVVVSKPMTDEEIESVFGKDLLSDEVKSTFAGMVIEVPAGKGMVTVEAQTTGGMTLKVKIGSTEPIEMELEGKLKMKFPYNVTEPTYVYIYAGEASAAGSRKSGSRGIESPSLKIYGISVSTDTYLKGDANGDGVISDADVIAVKDYIMGNEPENFVFEGADANEDGKVNVADIVEIVNKKK